MTAGIIIVALLGAASVAILMAPLLRVDAARAELLVDHLSAERDLASHQATILVSLKELEEDRENHKIGDDDYDSLKAQLTHQAVEIMKRIDEAKARRRVNEAPPRPRAVRETGSESE